MEKIYYLMGKSAAGKDTLYKRLLEDCPQLHSVALYTTRPMREGEQEGKEYHFISLEAMEMLERDGKIIEQRTYQTVCGPWSYATVDDGQIQLARSSCLMIGTLESYEKLRDYYGAEQVVPLYIQVPAQQRWERALEREKKQRNPNYEELKRRFQADEEDFGDENLKRLGIGERYSNENLELCLKQIKEVIESRSWK